MSYKQIGLYPANPNTARGMSTKLSASKDKIVYTNGKIVIIRDLKNPSLGTTFSKHVQNTTVARISPSGYYCASADVSGTVKIWDTVGEDQVVKGEYKVISGRINDLDWDGESKRIIAVGDGREKFGHAFTMDTGTSCGEIGGHSKVINAVSIRNQRPFRAATASDDAVIIFHQGVPYKYLKTINTHTKFVQDVRYAPSGDHFASVGSDMKMFVYDGKSGETLGEFTNGHKGSIMACSWSADSKSLVSSSLDCTVKLWDVETRKVVTTWALGTGVDNHQVGNVWTDEGDIVSLSMSGVLNVFDRRTGDKPTRSLHGPQKPITALAPTPADTFLAGAADGRVWEYKVADGEAAIIGGEAHSTLVTGLAASPAGTTYSVGYDDKVREIQDGTFVGGSCSTSTQPKSIACAEDGTLFVAEVKGIEAFRNSQRVCEMSTQYSPGSVTASGNLVAIGGEGKVHLYEWGGKSFKEKGVLEGNKALVTAVAISPDAALLVAGDSSGRIVLFDLAERKAITNTWSYHSARVNGLAWTADSKHCASASLDTHVYVWSAAKPLKNIAINNAIPGGANVVLWVGKPDGGKGRLMGAGADGCVRLWEVKFH